MDSRSAVHSTRAGLGQRLFGVYMLEELRDIMHLFSYISLYEVVIFFSLCLLCTCSDRSTVRGLLTRLYRPLLALGATNPLPVERIAALVAARTSRGVPHHLLVFVCVTLFTFNHTVTPESRVCRILHVSPPLVCVCVCLVYTFVER